MYKKYKHALKDAPSGQRFMTNYGEVKNLKELRTLLFAKGKKLFNQYVNDEENHFANWVEAVFKDDELAGSLRKTNSFHTTLKILDSRIRYLELWLEQNRDREEVADYILKNNPQALDYEPEHHKFETLTNHDSTWVEEFFPEKRKEGNQNSQDEFEDRLSREVKMLKELKDKYQFETARPGLIQRIFKRN